MSEHDTTTIIDIPTFPAWASDEVASIKTAAESSTFAPMSRLLLAALAHISTQERDLAAAVTRQQEAVVQKRAAERELGEFQTKVRDAVIEAAKTHDFCLEGTNEFLTGLGLDEWVRSWTVIGRFNNREVLRVTDVAVDTEDDAITHVTENVKGSVDFDGYLSVTLTCPDTAGIDDEDTTRVTYSDVDAGFDTDEFMSAFIDLIDWTAQPDQS